MKGLSRKKFAPGRQKFLAASSLKLTGATQLHHHATLSTAFVFAFACA